tara:strand:- start:251 stop:775 length:525 start_codon:yes stop_codon:yes gene_type:complete
VDNNKYILVFLLIVVTSFSNVLLSNIPNFSPVASVALFSGFYLSNKKIALLVPIICMLISDYFIGFHSLMWAVYLSFSATVVIGFLMKKANGKLIFLNSIFSAVLFFIITNFAVWASGSFYSKDFTGLLTCFSMGIPFLKNTLLSAVIFSSILFGGYEFFNQLVNKYLKVSKRT